ncbi:MAG: ATP-binding protein [Chloracidobacterium sp.]|nr:ATP-binding protein [Chloracidobacterium sp.]MDW8216459.1 ATP-binding protein [Acidobacteriota bacterium]
MPFPEQSRSTYTDALKSYVSRRIDLPAAVATLKKLLTDAKLQSATQLIALHHQALAALLEAGNLTPETLARAGDLPAALLSEWFRSAEEAVVADTWRAIVDQFPLPVWLFDPYTLKTRYANEAALQLYGYAADEWPGLDVVQLATADMREAWRDYLTEKPCEQTSPHQFTQPTLWRHQTKNAAPIAIHLAIARFRLGADVFCLAVAEETLGRQQREEQFRRMQRLEAIGQLTSGVAHNFNNILSVIQGYAEMIGARSSQLDARLAKQRAAILTAAKRGAELVRQLMIFSRKSDAVALVQDINPIVMETALLAERILSARVKFTKHLHPEPLYASVDAGQLSQALLNLVVNARDAMPEGGTLTVATSRVNLTAEQIQSPSGRIRACALPPEPGDYALITVADTGIGMSQETRQRLFEPFFTTKPSGKGTGLGLSMTYGCITECGGFIEVESALGVGTTFFLFLPMAEADPSLSPRPRHAWRPSGHYSGLTALVVEDEEDLLELICEWLTDAGFIVLAAQTAEEALRYIVAQQGKPIHLLVTDDILPEGGGQRVVEDALKEYPGCRCIVISGSFGARERMLGLPKQCVFLAKPFSENELLHAVKQAMTEQSA